MTWYRGICLLAEGKPKEARGLFQAVSAALPGELAPRLALALAAELAVDDERAAWLYDVVSRTDPGFTSACFGLIRMRERLGDRRAAAEALKRIQKTSGLHTAAQIALARTLIGKSRGANPGVTELVQASAAVSELGLDASQRAPLAVELLQNALTLLDSKTVQPNSEIRVFGHPLEKSGLSRALAQARRE